MKTGIKQGETKKQRSFRERVEGENLYQRAAAHWVARKLGVDAQTIAKVDFGFEEDFRLSAWTIQPGDGLQLTFLHNGNTSALPIDQLTPGEFIEQCVGILTELQAGA
jgi:hypothetical protein